MFAPTNDEDYFANINYSQNIECVVPTSELFVNFRTNGLRARKSCFIYAEKMELKGLIQLRLTEKCDQRRMYIITVDSGSFHELKQDQSLHVTFAGFIENLIRILQDCQSGKLELSLVQSPQQLKSDEYQLQFVEMRAFKNLVHLSLPCRLAPLNVVLFYLHSLLETMQKKIGTQEHTLQQLQLDLHANLRRIEQMDADNNKLRGSLMENTRAINQQHTEELEQLQGKMSKLNEQRQTDNELNHKTITGLRAQLEKLNAEKCSIEIEKRQEQKRNEAMTEELANYKSRVSTLKGQNEKLHAEITSEKNHERKLELHLTDARKHLADLQERQNRFDKAKAELVAELEAEKKISQTKRHALEMATEEISKANQIILKHSQELIKLKHTIQLRTEVALQQEKAINENERALRLRDVEIEHLRGSINTLRQEIPTQLESMRKFANALETKYTEQITVLKSRLRLCDKENYVTNAGVAAAVKRH